MANKVILVGRLGTDAELKKGNSGSSWGRMRLATDESYTDRDGKKVEKTAWHSVITFGRLAEICAGHLGKGSLVYVEGSLQTRSWDTRQQMAKRTDQLNNLVLPFSFSLNMGRVHPDEYAALLIFGGGRGFLFLSRQTTLYMFLCSCYMHRTRVAMKKSAPSITVRRSLNKFGEDLRFARLRRHLPMVLVAQRAKISLSTLDKIENGDPDVSLGNYAAVLFALSLGTPFAELVDPSKDEVGLQLDLESVPKRARKNVTKRARGGK